MEYILTITKGERDDSSMYFEATLTEEGNSSNEIDCTTTNCFLTISHVCVLLSVKYLVFHRK